MTLIDQQTTLLGTVDRFVPTHAADAQMLASAEHERERNRDAWQRLIDDYLVEWGRDLTQLAEDDLVAPSRELIDFACDVAIACRDDGSQAPIRVVPDGEGGVSFEWHDGPEFLSLDLREDGTIWLSVFNDSRRREHRQLH